MSEALLVVVTGPPASGKSSIARGLAHELRIPFISKDELKERLYEHLGHGEELEQAIERSSLAMLFSLAGSNLDAGVSVLVESNFETTMDTSPFTDLRVQIVQVYCGGDTDELVREFAERSANGERHPGHGDDPSDAEEVRRKVDAGLWNPLDLPGKLISLDMSGDENIDPADVAARIP